MENENKRFKLYEHKDNDYILDNPNEHLDFIEMLGDALTSEEIVNLLNELNDEKEELKDLLNACKKGQQNLIKDGKKCNDALNKIWDILKEEIKGETDD